MGHPADTTERGEREYPGLDYARRLHALVVEWYKSAEAKAQLLLTVDGAFIAFLTGSLFARPDEIGRLFRVLSPPTWTLLAGMCVALLASLAFALDCVWSRILSARALGADLARVPADQKKSYPPAIVGFFQHISKLEAARLVSSLETSRPGYELEALCEQLVKLSGNVVKKHRAVNRGLTCAALSFVFFLLAGISYLIDVRRDPAAASGREPPGVTITVP